MKKFLVIALLILLAILPGCFKNPAANQEDKPTKEITDMVGRKVTVPGAIKKIYATSQIGTILVYSFSPGLIADNADVQQLSGHSNDKFAGIPGSMPGGEGNTNVEKILKLKPDIVISATMADQRDETAISNADKLAGQLGIPVIVVKSNLKEMDKTYDFMGELLGETERSKVLAEYCRQTISETLVKVSQVPEEKRVRVYYAEGPGGLQTDPANSRHTEVLDLVRGLNVSEVPVKAGFGQSSVSLEKVMLWNPEVIISWNAKPGAPFIQEIKEAGWKNIKAVQKGQVYDIPTLPFNWFDRPPSINRLIGVKWLANLLYPEYVPLDIKAETKKFYKLFYHVDVSDQEVEELLRYSIRK